MGKTLLEKLQEEARKARADKMFKREQEKLTDHIKQKEEERKHGRQFQTNGIQ
jgi:hypothetical protein